MHTSSPLTAKSVVDDTNGLVGGAGFMLQATRVLVRNAIAATDRVVVGGT